MLKLFFLKKIDWIWGNNKIFVQFTTHYLSIYYEKEFIIYNGNGFTLWKDEDIYKKLHNGKDNESYMVFILRSVY